MIGVPHHVPLDGADALWPTLAGRAVTDLSLPPGGQPIVGIDASSRRV
ncbi:hypothetical protein [Microbacterium sediminis]|nr:hypothetical protein [Microbacterium sediminis]